MPDSNIVIERGFDDDGAYISVNDTKFRRATEAMAYIVVSFGLTGKQAAKLVMEGF